MASKRRRSSDSTSTNQLKDARQIEAEVVNYNPDHSQSIRSLATGNKPEADQFPENWVQWDMPPEVQRAAKAEAMLGDPSVGNLQMESL